MYQYPPISMPDQQYVYPQGNGMPGMRGNMPARGMGMDYDIHLLQLNLATLQEQVPCPPCFIGTHFFFYIASARLCLLSQRFFPSRCRLLVTSSGDPGQPPWDHSRFPRSQHISCLVRVFLAPCQTFQPDRVAHSLSCLFFFLLSISFLQESQTSRATGRVQKARTTTE